MITIEPSDFLIWPSLPMCKVSLQTAYYLAHLWNLSLLQLLGHEIELPPLGIFRAFEVPKFILWEALFQFCGFAPATSDYKYSTRRARCCFHHLVAAYIGEPTVFSITEFHLDASASQTLLRPGKKSIPRYLRN